MKSLKLTTCILLGMAPASVSAQQLSFPADVNDAPVFLGTIVLSTALNPEAEDGVSVTSEALALSNPADLSELFVAEPTLAVGSSIPVSQKLYVNGIEENNLAISIDGARQNNRVFHHNTTTLVDPTLLEAVRIDAGVAPADAGPGALAGALDYQTRDVSSLLDDGDTFGGFYKLEYGTNGNNLTNSVALYSNEDRFEALSYARYTTGDNLVDGDGDDITGSGANLLSFLGKATYETETGHRLKFTMEQITDDDARPYRANIGLVTAGRPVPLTRDYDLTRTNFNLEYTTTAPTDFWDPTIRLSHSGTKLINDETGLSTAQYTEGETTSLSGELSNKFKLGGGDLNVGIDFFADQSDIDYASITTPSWDYTAGEELRNIGAFAQLRVQPIAHARLSTGLRADFQEFTGDDGSIQTTEGVSYNLSGEYDVTNEITLSAGYSHVWGGIELAENYILNPDWDYSAESIEDVTSDNVYVAASYTTGTWAIDGKLFSTEIDNSRAATWGGGPSLTADVDSTGYEIGLSKNWNDGFVRVGYANIDTDVNGSAADSYSGNYLTIPMGEIISLQTAHQFTNGVTLGGDAQIALDYDDTDDLQGGNPTIAGYTVVNTFVEYEPSQIQGLNLRAEINNVFDELYVSRATYGQDFPTEVEALYEAGRSLRMTAEYTF